MTVLHRTVRSSVLLLCLGCGARTTSYSESHWTVVDIHDGEIGEYLPDGLPAGTPLGYTVDYLECRRGRDAIAIRVENGHSPAGLSVDDTFVLTRPLSEIPRAEDRADGLTAYYVLEEDVSRLESK